LSGVNRFGLAFVIGDGKVDRGDQGEHHGRGTRTAAQGPAIRAAALQVQAPSAGVFQLTAAGEINGDHWAEDNAP
jgi:hypothetical protein